MLKNEVMLKKLDFIILKDLEVNNKTNTLKSYTVKEFSVIKNNVIKTNALYKRLENLYKLGFVDYGIADKNAKTYFITNKGIEILNIIK